MPPFIYFFEHSFGHVNLYRIALSVNGYVLESELGYNFEPLAGCSLQPLRRTDESQKRTKQLSTVEVAGLV